jgi:prolipoprotein diacylglyceryl transferase
MIDSHSCPADWGVRPVLFTIDGIGIPSYSFFVLMGLIAGIVVFNHNSKKDGVRDRQGVIIAAGAIAGGIFGAKIFEWLLNYRFVLAHFSDPEIWLSGRTITGGLIGGKLGAVLIKKKFGIRERKGNYFAPAVAIGVMIGRIGCFCRGCCYGKPTSLPFGTDFGDGIYRHPTQLYEALFMLGMFLYLEKRRRNDHQRPGYLFKLLMLAYFTFRFFIEFIRAETVVLAGMTAFQLISVIVALYFIWDIFFNLNHKEKTYAGQP